MNIYQISYDLNRPGQNYNNLYNGIKSLGGWAHPLDSTWLVSTSLNANQIADRLKPYFDSTDRYFISRITSDHAGWLSKEVWDWIANAIQRGVTV